MARTIITAADWQSQPWKNGRGTTREVARWPTGADAYDWRVSVAEVTEPGPFSKFRGYIRWTFLLEGKRLGLTVNRKDTHWLVSPMSDTRTAGGTPMEALLPDGPVRVLNVLAKHGTVEASRTAMTGTLVRLAFAYGDCPALGLARGSAMIFDPVEPAVAGDLVYLIER
jgi:environmental stress-induced protein Ves